MNLWIFSSKTIENIEVAEERLLWGFWDREAGEKQRQNWRSFIRLYNKIKPFDMVFFQIAGTGEIHALGIVKETFYDDQTPIWPNEQRHVLYPWKVSLCTMIFSEKPFITHFVKIESYVDGYGIGELPEFEFRRILTETQKQVNVDLNIG
jgi:hypothetical protein